ncbi:NADPH-dependent diflavin oxidoreductase 1-like isoform X2 [Phragmites australis]|uniref:NADPH-dependent diflavin oxidoreductase 1-like isoform X2 n=1 Tax=Phragmites australis TaxID=29695 RepID=UPI002D77AC3E|nr:NADPH-dependent diflavin oxidoreductase 1-like isoform X2 [Phragmites australis]XP_062205781.1 NADPH-dependent diflavin oxidoreductase 1-like isoform X2 [Phragmites australis]
MGDVFPELKDNEKKIQDIIRDEEESFENTLAKGYEKFKKAADAVKENGGTLLSGQDAFVLWDTYGYPIDLTEVMAIDYGLTVDKDGFNDSMEEARQKARNAHNTAGGNFIVMDANATAQLRNQGLASTDDSPKFMWPKARLLLPLSRSHLSMAPPSSPPSPLPAASGRLVILYASQTGNSMDVAERVGREAERGGCPTVDVLSMDRFDPSCLPGKCFVVFVVSTMGQGDPPDSMKGFWKYLLPKHLGARWLEGLHYAVFGLGDSGYQKYNFPAKKLDQRLLDLGAKRIIEKGLGDDQHPAGYEGALDPWLQSLWKSLNQTNVSLLPRISDIIHPNLNMLGDAKIEVIYYSAPQDTSISDSKRLIDRARSMSPALKFHNDREPPYMLRMVTNQRLTKEDSERDVRHFELEDPCSAISYQVGDALEILPRQNSSTVDAFIKRCNLDPDCYITIRAKGGVNVPKGSLVNCLMDRIKLKTFVALTMDVASASPRRYFFEIMSYFATAKHEKERLQYFASPEGRDDLYQYNQKENRTVLEVLEDFPSVQMPFEWLVQLTPPLKKRGFSISSSPLAQPNQIHLTVSIVSWLTPFKRTRHGLCSTWLAGLSPNEENLIPCWIHRGSLPRPLPSIPLLLIGPGTGCAPFRAFVEERAAQSVAEPTAPILFFFGCRNQDSDFLYKDFWLNHAQNQGVLSLKKGGGFFVAFSRDQPEKIYVQDKIKEQSARVWNILCSDVAIYVAGSSTKMPADVTAALEEVICQEGGVPKQAGSGWLRELKRAGVQIAF